MIETEDQPQVKATRNDLPVLLYDPSPEGRAARAADPRYAHARRALDRTEDRFGRRPATIRGLPKIRGARAAGNAAPAGQRSEPPPQEHPATS